MSDFECSKCGLCCKSLKKQQSILGFLDRGDGVCMYLKDNLCSIYENRPDVCRVDVMYERYFKDQMSKEEFYQLNYESCRILQAEAKANSLAIMKTVEGTHEHD